ncbi:hypothetical protein GCM10017559_71180 [Streptosporangium longisporum]|uniref:Uncharacterized protein n=1 Tax=Streptosporangium longisporum TaxID=46187 RepID=A0ABP6L8G2_9ACTN
MAHRLEAPVVRGEVPGPPARLHRRPDWERDLYENMVKAAPGAALAGWTASWRTGT